MGDSHGTRRYGAREAATRTRHVLWVGHVAPGHAALRSARTGRQGARKYRTEGPGRAVQRPGAHVSAEAMGPQAGPRLVGGERACVGFISPKLWSELGLGLGLGLELGVG